MPASSLDSEIRRVFRERGVRFHHAENLRHFSWHCAAGALVARNTLLTQSGHTSFSSDSEDARLGVLDRVFGNLRDFGTIMARGTDAIPNIYGPITLTFTPSVFSLMTDVMITQKSIMSLGDSWRTEAAHDAATIAHITSGTRSNQWIANDWSTAELSCSQSSISFRFLEQVTVEPIHVGGRPLIEYVRADLARSGHTHVRVSERHYTKAQNRTRMTSLASYCEALPTTGIADGYDFHGAVNLPDWSSCPVARRNRLAGWARYFYFGTVQEVRRRQALAGGTAALDAGSSSSPAVMRLEDTLAQQVTEKYTDNFIESVQQQGYPIGFVELWYVTVTVPDERVGFARFECSFSGEHHSEDGISFDGAIVGRLSFDQEAGTHEALRESVELTEASVAFDFDEPDQEL